MGEKEVFVRRVHTTAEYEAVQHLHRTIWGFSPQDTVMHLPMMVAIQRYGGLVLGAFADKPDGSTEMVGFAVGFVGQDSQSGTFFHYSQVVGILKEWQSKGVGQLLKLAQRREALGQGHKLIRWAFDPLEARNAYFNIAKLGGVARHYEINMYGTGKGELFGSLDTDRLIIDWDLDSARVNQRVIMAESGQKLELPLAEYLECPRLIEVEWLDGQIPVAASVNLSQQANRLLLEVPYSNKQVQNYDFNLALQWRSQTRAAFTDCFNNNYYVADFFTYQDEKNTRAFYILEYVA